MKAFLVVFAAVVACSRAITIQEQRAQMVAAAQECKVEYGASDNDLSLLILKKPMTTKEGKCLLACIMESMGIVENDKLHEKNFIEFVSVPAKNNQDIIKKMREIAAECEDVHDPDRCEMGAKAAYCFKKGMIARKVKVDIGI